MASAEINLSLTEMPQFRRLVDFARAVENHADAECDIALQELVRELHDDLREMR